MPSSCLFQLRAQRRLAIVYVPAAERVAFLQSFCQGASRLECWWIKCTLDSQRLICFIYAKQLRSIAPLIRCPTQGKVVRRHWPSLLLRLLPTVLLIHLSRFARGGCAPTFCVAMVRRNPFFVTWLLGANVFSLFFPRRILFSSSFFCLSCLYVIGTMIKKRIVFWLPLLIALSCSDIFFHVFGGKRVITICKCADNVYFVQFSLMISQTSLALLPS